MNYTCNTVNCFRAFLFFCFLSRAYVWENILCETSVWLTDLFNNVYYLSVSGNPRKWLKMGVHLKAVFWLGNMVLMQISRCCFKQSKIYLTNRFHVAVRLFSNRSQMTSKCGKNKKVEGVDSRVCHWCSYHILTSSVIYYCTDARQHGIYLFYTIKKRQQLQLFISKSFPSTRKPAFAHFGKHEKKAIWRNLLSIKNETISLVAMHNKELWLVKKNHATVKLDSNGFSWNENLQRKQNWTAKSPNVKENAGKINSVFVIRARSEKAWTFPWILLELKEYARKTCGCGQHWTPFDSSFEWKEGYRRLQFVSSVVSDSQNSLTWYRRHHMAAIQLAPSCVELYFSRCCALKRTGTFASESKVTCSF